MIGILISNEEVKLCLHFDINNFDDFEDPASQTFEWWSILEYLGNSPFLKFSFNHFLKNILQCNGHEENMKKNNNKSFLRTELHTKKVQLKQPELRLGHI